MSAKEDQLIAIQKMLDRELDEKMSLIEEKTRDDEQRIEEQKNWQLERLEFENKLGELKQLVQQTVIKYEQDSQESFQREREVLEQKLVNMKREVERLQLIIDTPDDMEVARFDTNDNDKILPSREGNVSTTATLERKFKRFFGFQNSNSAVSSPGKKSSSWLRLFVRSRR